MGQTRRKFLEFIGKGAVVAVGSTALPGVVSNVSANNVTNKNFITKAEDPSKKEKNYEGHFVDGRRVSISINNEMLADNEYGISSAKNLLHPGWLHIKIELNDFIQNDEDEVRIHNLYSAPFRFAAVRGDRSFSLRIPSH